MTENRPDELARYAKVFKECRKIDSLREPYQKEHDWTLLHFAVKHNHHETAKILIDAGLNVNAKDIVSSHPSILHSH